MIRAACIAIFSILIGLMSVCALGWAPTGHYHQIAIWPKGKMPNAKAISGVERTQVITHPSVAGKSWLAVSPVTNPTITVYSPAKKKNTGAAVVVFPGGGYWILAMDLEGTEICHWLNSPRNYWDIIKISCTW